MVHNYSSNDIDLVQPTQYPIPKTSREKATASPQTTTFLRGLGYLAERLTACVCSFLTGVHGAQLYGGTAVK